MTSSKEKVILHEQYHLLFSLTLELYSSTRIWKLFFFWWKFGNIHINTGFKCLTVSVFPFNGDGLFAGFCEVNRNVGNASVLVVINVVDCNSTVCGTPLDVCLNED